MIIYNIDTLQFSVLTKNYNAYIEKFLDELEICKSLAIENRANNINSKAIITIGNMNFYILPNGSQGYAYILHNDLYQIKLAKWENRNENFYPIMVTVKQETLWSLSPVGAYYKVREWIINNFGEIVNDKISRVDLCCHTDEIDFSKIPLTNFKGKFRINETISSDINTNRKISTLTFGSRSGRIYLRIYNKSLEVKQKKKTWFLDVWKENGLNSNNVWNVEFELKRDFMVSVNIDSVSDFFAHIQSIWSYLTCEWFVVTNKDRTRIENATTFEEWQHIQNAYSEYESVPLVKRTKQTTCNAEVLVPALCGYLTSFSALRNSADLDTSLIKLKNDISLYLKRKNTDFNSIVSDKIKLI